MEHTRNLLITGIPRSGTTLITATLHDIPNCVALGEPEELKQLHKTSASPAEYAEKVSRFAAMTRQRILAREPIAMHFDKGAMRVPSNYFKRTVSPFGTQAERTYELREAVATVMNESFTLALKNNAQFTSCLEALLAHKEFTVLAVVRHPLACLLSWRSLRMPVSFGKLPAGERFSRELRKVAKLEDVLLAQVKILDWFFGVYFSLRDRVQLVRYEDFVAAPESVRRFADAPQNHVFPKYESLNRRPEYDFREERRIFEYLQRHSRFVHHFYSLEAL